MTQGLSLEPWEQEEWEEEGGRREVPRGGQMYTYG